jgi:tetratricopeptide (TPR) repeat protein
MREPRPEQIPTPRGGAARAPADPMSRLILSQVDGRTTIAAIAEVSGVSVELACRIAGALARDGQLLLDEGTVSPSTPSERGVTASDAAAGADGEFGADVDAFVQDIGARNYYEILSLEPDADRAALKLAYFDLSKRYHPDRAFGSRGGELKKKMEVIFCHITRAYETLSSPEERAEYDACIADQIQLWKIGRQLRRAVDSTKSPSAPAAPSASPAATARSAAASRPSPARGGVSSQPPTRTPPAKESPVPLSAREAELKRENWRKERMGRTLGMLLPQAPEPARKPMQGELEKGLDEASLAIEVGRFSDAVKLLRKVIAQHPSSPRSAELLKRAEVGAAREISSGYLRQGRFESQHGDPDFAIEKFDKAIAADPSNLEARHLLAEMLLERRRDLGRALSLCREVIGLGGQRAKYFATLGEILLLSKDKARAAEAFERALEIEPDNKDVKKKLKMCRG